MSANGRVVVFDTLAGAAYGKPPVDGRQIAVVDHPPVLSSANLDVGTVAVGYPGPEWFLVLANQGPSSFIPALVEVDNPDFLISGGTCVDQIGAPVPPGGACTVNLMLMPSVPGEITGTLTVSEDGFGAQPSAPSSPGSAASRRWRPRPVAAYGGPLVVGARDEPMPFSRRQRGVQPGARRRR